MLPIQRYILAQYRKCAAKRGYEWALTDEVALEIMACACVYCGAEDTCTATRKQYAVSSYTYNGIDRVNSELPYTAGNTVSCCKACNAAKSARTLVEFLNSPWLADRILSVRGV
jgi:hypothetical protein